MNRKEFKQCMKQGLGRCAVALSSSDSIEKYKDIVLYGCLHNLSYDTQCEGTRAGYVYRLTQYFHDDDYFLLPSIEAFEELPNSSDWLFAHFVDLLQKFAENGNERARKALQAKYEQLLFCLLKKHRFSSYDFARDNFERISLSLISIGDYDEFLEMAEKMGSLFKQNPHYKAEHFDYFWESISDMLGEKGKKRLLEKETSGTDNMKCFIRTYLKFLGDSRDVPYKSAGIPVAQDIQDEVKSTGKLSFYASVRFRMRGDKDEKLKLAELAVSESDTMKKAELLSAFMGANEGFPLSHTLLFEYAQSSYQRLREVSLEILTNCRSEEVRQYALQLLTEGRDNAYAIEMLLNNYTPEIKKLLLEELYKIKVRSTTDDWHSIGIKILDVNEKYVRLPKEFFYYIYNTTLCSCCRADAVKELSKRRWLTREMIEECRHDSFSDISRYINRYYPKEV